MRRVLAVVVAAVVCLTAGCTGGGEKAPARPAPSTTPAPSPPAGWRWESFRDVEVAVPSAWGQGTADWPSCLPRQAPEGYVGRPGAVPLVGCWESRVGRHIPADDAAISGSFVWLRQPRTGPQQVQDRVTVEAGGVEVVVQAPAPVREKILASVRTVSTDVNGCPVAHPIAADPAWRPRPASSSRTPVTSLSICRYALDERDGHPGPSLIRSARVTGAAADRAVRATATGAPGGGPNQRSFCVPEVMYGDEVIVLRAPGREIVVRYAGCDYHGFDDGARVTALTKHGLAHVFVGGMNPGEVSNGRVADLMPPPPGG